jgi:hypothetical protein
MLSELQFHCVSVRFNPARYLRFCSRVLTASRAHFGNAPREDWSHPIGRRVHLLTVTSIGHRLTVILRRDCPSVPQSSRRIMSSNSKGCLTCRRRRAGHQVVRVGGVHKNLLVRIATTPLPRPVQSVTTPPEYVGCHGGLVCAVVNVEMRVLGHCPCLTRASTAGGALADAGWCQPLRHPSHPRAWGWRAAKSELGDGIS